MIDAAHLHTPPTRFSAAAGQAKNPTFAGKFRNASPDKQDDPKLREAFDSFVGETFYGQMLASMHKMHGKSKYFNGGRGEEVFQGQLDQALATEMTKSNGNSFADALYHLFAQNRKS